jgi:hypothetical protein
LILLFAGSISSADASAGDAFRSVTAGLCGKAKWSKPIVKVVLCGMTNPLRVFAQCCLGVFDLRRALLAPDPFLIMPGTVYPLHRPSAVQ